MWHAALRNSEPVTQHAANRSALNKKKACCELLLFTGHIPESQHPRTLSVSSLGLRNCRQRSSMSSLQIKLGKHFIRTQSIYRFWKQLIGPAVCLWDYISAFWLTWKWSEQPWKKSPGLMIQRAANNTKLSSVIWEDTGRLQRWNTRKICIKQDLLKCNKALI